MTTCFINIVNMFFNMFLKNVLKTRKRFKNQSPIKLLFQTFLKRHLDILKTFLKCQIVSWAFSRVESPRPLSLLPEQIHSYLVLYQKYYRDTNYNYCLLSKKTISRTSRFKLHWQKKCSLLLNT